MLALRTYRLSIGAALALCTGSAVVLMVLSSVTAITGWNTLNPDDDVKRVVLADVAPRTRPAGDGAPAAAAGARRVVLGQGAPHRLLLGDARPRRSPVVERLDAPPSLALPPGLRTEARRRPRPAAPRRSQGDLVVAAYRDARAQADRLAAEKLGPLAGGLGGLGGGGFGDGGLPGLPGGGKLGF